MPECYAIVIGSGFDDCADATSDAPVVTRFGEPSAAIKRSEVAGRAVLTLARHGDAHNLPPHAINYRANMLALKEAGVESVIALNTVGVISKVRESGEIAVPDQILDYTWGRQHTIFDGDDGIVEHFEFTQPFTASLRRGLLGAAAAADIDCYDGGVYAATQGPRLETAAEVDRLERDGADFVGMTAMPEAALARELGLHYACLSLIVNRAAGRGDAPIHDDVAASTQTARNNARALLQHFFANL